MPTPTNLPTLPPDDQKRWHCLRERADAFWEWFCENEPRLLQRCSRRLRPDCEPPAFVKKGAALLAQGLCLRLGSGPTLAFFAPGSRTLAYLLPYVAARAPACLRDHWKLFPLWPGTGGRDFGMSAAGTLLYAHEVLTEAAYDPARGGLVLSVYSHALAAMEPAQARHSFCLLLERAAGEGLTRAFVRRVELLHAPTAGMLPLHLAAPRLEMLLRIHGENPGALPGRRTVSYSFPARSGGPRCEPLSGASCCPALAADFHARRRTLYRAFCANGARAVYLFFPYTPVFDPRRIHELRGEVEERLQQEVCGNRDSGRECGVVLGGAMGAGYVYIDLLLYDPPAFFHRAPPLLCEYPQPFFWADFHCAAAPHPLTPGRSNKLSTFPHGMMNTTL